VNQIPDEVINRFASKKNLSIIEATKQFKKLEVFLELASSDTQNPTLEVDEAWHEFILHTKQYADFCFSRFGKFIHHKPNESQDCSNCSTEKCSSGSQIFSGKQNADCNSCSSDCRSV
jgi:hypothetical protein